MYLAHGRDFVFHRHGKVMHALCPSRETCDVVDAKRKHVRDEQGTRENLVKEEGKRYRAEAIREDYRRGYKRKGYT